MKKPGNYEIPFINGAMQEYVWSESAPGLIWRPNSIFAAVLELEGSYRGRSAARVKVKNVENGETYSMGFATFYDAVVAFGVADARIAGLWCFRKQGSNYGVSPVTEGERPSDYEFCERQSVAWAERAVRAKGASS